MAHSFAASQIFSIVASRTCVFLHLHSIAPAQERPLCVQLSLKDRAESREGWKVKKSDRQFLLLRFNQFCRLTKEGTPSEFQLHIKTISV